MFLLPSSGCMLILKGGGYFPAFMYVPFPTRPLVLQWRQTPLQFGMSLCACGCQKVLHTSMCLNSWLRCSGRKRPLGARHRKRQRGGLFLSAMTETQLLIYGVSASWAGHVLPERPATGGGEGEGKSRGLRRTEKGGGSRVPTQQWGHIHGDIYI